MKFTVVWKRLANAKLATIWIEAADRSAVSAAADAIDHLLKTSPLDQGESRSDNERVLIVSPLAVLYEVHVEDRRVDVLAVRHLPKH
jgi:plasmid stabilization system protein ParE